jgi:hypothetical protein
VYFAAVRALPSVVRRAYFYWLVYLLVSGANIRFMVGSLPRGLFFMLSGLVLRFISFFKRGCWLFAGWFGAYHISAATIPA